jgi:hypothetical protein
MLCGNGNDNRIRIITPSCISFASSPVIAPAGTEWGADNLFPLDSSVNYLVNPENPDVFNIPKNHFRKVEGFLLRQSELRAGMNRVVADISRARAVLGVSGGRLHLSLSGTLKMRISYLYGTHQTAMIMCPSRSISPALYC